MGLISVGAGKQFFNNKFSIDFNYGYLPKKINGVSVHSIALRPFFTFYILPLSDKEIGFYAGTTIVYGITSKTYTQYPGYYPKGYYKQNAIHFNPFIGNSFSFPLEQGNIKSMKVFAEVGTVDYQIWYALKNKEISANDIINLSFGLGFNLK